MKILVVITCYLLLSQNCFSQNDISKWENLSYNERLEVCKIQVDSILKKIKKIDFKHSLSFQIDLDTNLIIFGGFDEDLRGQCLEDSILLYSSSLDYLDKAVSTFFHEYFAHYQENKLNLIPNTDNRRGAELDVNPFLELDYDPYDGKDSIMVDVLLPPFSLLLEESNGYFLEFELDYNGFVCLKEKDLLNLVAIGEKHRKEYLNGMVNVTKSKNDVE